MPLLNRLAIRDKLRSVRGYWPWLLPLLGFFASLQLVQMDTFVKQTFEQQRWRLPSTVYARPLELSLDTALKPDELEHELEELSYQRVSNLKQAGEYVVESGLYTIYRRPFQYWDGAEAAKKIKLALSPGPSSTQIVRLEVNGKSVDRVRLDPLKIGGIYPSEKEDRKLVQLPQVPKHLIDALIAIEDRDFYRHWGISPPGITRAMWNNLRSGEFVQGGSTITQQLVKNSYLTSERSFRRKMKEALYAVMLEFHYSKEEILESYINSIYLGQSGNNAIHGFGLASEYYFGRSLDRLTLDQTALLVAMVNGPSLYNPTRNPERCLMRRNLVLKVMVEQKKLSTQAFAIASKKPIKVNPSLRWTPNRFPAYLDLVRRNLQRDYETDYLAAAGLQIFTGLDPLVQWKSEKAVSAFVKAQGKRADKLEVAAVVVSEEGEVQAIIGSKVSGYQGFNRALDARRSIGSLAKPAVLLAALDDSDHYSLQTTVADDPVKVMIRPGEYWEPKNFDDANHGQVSLLTMLSKSYNQAAVRLGMHVGIDKVKETFQKLTGRQDIPGTPSIMLGSMGMSPFEVAGMYHTIFTGGSYSELKTVRVVLTRDGKPLRSYPLRSQRVFDEKAIQELKVAMRAVVDRGTGVSAYDYLPRGLTAAGKTGTTNGQRDSWFAGFTGDKLAVAWVGNDQNERTNLTGSNGGLTVWAKIMASISRKPLPFGSSPTFTAETPRKSNVQARSKVANPLSISGKEARIAPRLPVSKT